MASSSTFTPILTATPSAPPTYNVGMAETFSWVPVEGAGRPLFARATYLANPEDIKISLSATNINFDLDELVLNTDQLEELIDVTNTALLSFETETKTQLNRSNTLLNSLTALTQREFNDTQTLLDSLTSLQESSQNNIITLLNQLTANTDSLEVNTDGVEFLLSGTNILINALTAVDYSTATKQDVIITLLDTLTANQTATDISGLETRLDVLTAVDYATSAKQDESNSLLGGLTAIQVDKQDQIITLLHAITGTAIEVELTADQIDLHVDDVETLLHDLTATNIKVPGFSIPPYDEISLDYYGSTNNLSNVIYKTNTTSVLSLSFMYVTYPPTSNDALLVSVKKI